jgi:GAF domain-containing protein
VIAIENRAPVQRDEGSPERQTATAEILKVIASSPSSVQPVFDAILENATRLCEAELGGLYLAQDEVWSMVSFRGEDPSVQELFRDIRPGPLTGLGRMRKEGKPIHIADLRADAATEQRDPVRMATLDRLGARTFLAVPLTKDGAILGAVVIYRREVRPFTDAQIRLVRTFADQAVIAIENVRLFKRNEGGAREADRDRGDPQGHRQLAERRSTGVQCHRRKRATPVRWPCVVRHPGGR